MGSEIDKVFSLIVSILVLVDLILWPHCIGELILLLACFNPCFGGSYIVTVSIVLYIPYYSLFQSLFWWILYCDNVQFILVHFSFLSFNPCFGGSYIVTWFLCFILLSGIAFQSLFWWILYCDLLNVFYCFIVIIVSILVLVDLILWPFCFAITSLLYLVSILVLVDLILWQ